MNAPPPLHGCRAPRSNHDNNAAGAIIDQSREQGSPMRSQTVRWIVSLSGVAVCALTAGLAAGQAYPTKPIRMLVPFAPGGGADLVARLVAPRLSERLAQPVVVDNRPTAGGMLAAELAARAAPDGHTLLVPTSNHAANPSLYKITYDTVNDFAPITLAVVSPLVMVVHPSLPVNNLQEFIAYAKANPAKLNYGAAGAGGPPHLAGELLKTMAGIQMTPIMYKGIAPAVTAVLGNEIQVTFVNIFVIQPHVRAGRLRALGITGLKRSQAAPDWPTIAESGLSGYEASIWFGFLAPAKTPKPVIARLHREITSILKLPEIRQTIIAQGGDPVASTPGEFDRIIRDDIERIARLVKTAGIRAD
jgi:tripartite-type tricarboxylate transporter receptor subunit TctC